METFYVIGAIKFSAQREQRNQGLYTFFVKSIEVIKDQMTSLSPFFKKGNALVTLYASSDIAVIDLESEEIVWLIRKGIINLSQNHTLYLNNGHILTFDMHHKPEASKILEFEPITYDMAWDYGGTAGHPIYSPHYGTVQRLFNGNTLITESAKGKALEVTPYKKIVWEFLSPHTSEDGKYIATLFEVIRVTKKDLAGWIPSLEK